MEGMDEFGLLTFLRGNKAIVLPLLFPRIAASVIDKEAVKSLIRLEDEDAISVQLVELLKQYIEHVGSENNGKVGYCLIKIIHCSNRDAQDLIFHSFCLQLELSRKHDRE
jgi:hypothetical protein